MDVKSALASRTVWGALIMIAATAAQMFGIDIGGTEGWLEPLMQLFGAVLALYGRFKAVKKVTLTGS